ncbi:hypothetical protein DDW05_03105 [Candidatus Nanobsidianus stetteri]|uniref:Uncharacterized protein n=1 Tax=Nanobsidianus stetteri TaxID=1294122 RepID=A0A2T9WQC5_NANST|nr:hypothetical protein DDW05_03105 [Candidatus Nanobsidianus stetteri]
MTDTPSYENQSKTLEETLKDTKEEKGNAKTLEDMIKKVELKIVKTKAKYKDYATAIEVTYENVNKVDRKSIPLLKDLIEAMESIPIDIELKTYILYNITTYINEKIIFGESYRRERNIENLRIGMKFLKNEKGLRKMNELYSRVLAGKILLRNFREYLEEIRDRAPDLDQETQIKYARQKVAYDYLGTIIKGLLRDPTKYEPLYKQFIETDDLGEFVKHLPKYIKS